MQALTWRAAAKEWTLREALRAAALCLGFVFFHCALYASLRTFLLFGRMRLRGYADYAEQKTFKDFAEDHFLERSLFLFLLCLAVAAIALRSPVSAAPFTTAGLLFYVGVAVARGFKLNPVQWL